MNTIDYLKQDAKKTYKLYEQFVNLSLSQDKLEEKKKEIIKQLGIKI